ncbi:MAG: hypothetical protein JNM00_12765 [Flavobacteriales bacterium]|nr:hypothetical protein [Flavobacteriales bacterium]
MASVLVLATGTEAQTISRHVFSGGGDSGYSGVIHVSATLGEPCVGTHMYPGINFSAGFQQPEWVDQNLCIGDFDNNGVINVSDLLIFFADFGCTSSCGMADLDGNGVVNVGDLLLLMALFGTSCS